MPAAQPSGIQYLYFQRIIVSIMNAQMTFQKKRFRDYGFTPGRLPVGERNMISDVHEVRVGHCTRSEGNDIRTGVTIIDPGVPDLFRNKLPAAIAVGNGFGKLAGTTQIEELGTLETPIGLTNTLAVGAVVRGVVDIVLAETSDIGPTETVNAVVGETNDGLLNAIHKNVVTGADVRAAYDARSSAVSVGCVGAGTGTRAFSWKGGIGTSSRVVTIEGKKYIVGALVQTNYGGDLAIMGVPVGAQLDHARPQKTPDGSCMIVLATDAPLSARQLKHIARRSFLALGRTGSVMAHGSGDYAIAFSTSHAGVEGSGDRGMCVRDDLLTDFFLATVEAVEESVYDALFAAETVRGRDGNVLEALPVGRVVEILRAALR